MSCAIPSSVIEQTIAFHGHSCPGLAIGIRAAELALRELGDPADTDMVAVAETDMCGVDAIQFITGCTYGKGNFLHRDHGKMAFSFFDRLTGKGVRALLNPEPEGGSYGEMKGLMALQASGDATPNDETRVVELRAEQQKRFMTQPLDEMFTITRLKGGAPRPAAILQSLVCQGCGESVMESRTRRFGGKALCIPCFEGVEQKM